MESFASIDSFLSKQESGSDAFGAVSSGSRRSLGSESSVISQIKDRVKQRELIEGASALWQQDLLLSQQISGTVLIHAEEAPREDDKNDNEPDLIHAGIVYNNWDDLFLSNVKMDNFLDPSERIDSDGDFEHFSYIPSGMLPPSQQSISSYQESNNDNLVIESLEDEIDQYTATLQAQFHEDGDIETLHFSDDDEDDNNDLHQQFDNGGGVFPSDPNLQEQEDESEQQELQFLLELVAQDRRRHQDFLTMMLSRFPVGHALNNMHVRNTEEEDDSRGDLESKPSNNNNGLESLEEMLNNMSSDEEDERDHVEEDEYSDLVHTFEAL